jgi:hypothetical protein
VSTTLDGKTHKIGVDTTGGNRTATLPDATTCKGHHFIVYKKVAANTVTVNTLGGNINGVATKAWTSMWTSFSFYSNGTDYVIE